MKKDEKKKKESKPQYQAPVILDLGELARGAGETCSPGAVPHGIGSCKSGGQPAGTCVQGNGR